MVAYEETSMIRRFVCAAVVTCVTLGIAMAEDFNAVVTKVEGDKVTFHKTMPDKEDKKKTVKGEAMTLTVAKDAKIVSAKKVKGRAEVGDAITDGLKGEAFTKIDDKKGLSVQITTSEGNKAITQIAVYAPKKKKDAK